MHHLGDQPGDLVRLLDEQDMALALPDHTPDLLMLALGLDSPSPQAPDQILQVRARGNHHVAGPMQN